MAPHGDWHGLVPPYDVEPDDEDSAADIFSGEATGYRLSAPEELGSDPELRELVDVAAAISGALSLPTAAAGELALALRTIVERLKADLDYHQALAAEEEAEAAENEYGYGEADIAAAYSGGRVEALRDALSLLAGREVKMYSETERAKSEGQ